jgi:hypothetical protein
VALLVGWALGSMVSASFGMASYLTALIYGITLAVGCLFFVLIQHLCRAGWSVVVRRIAELVMVMIIPLAVLFLPILGSLLFGEGTLYRWDDPNYATEHHLPMAVWAEKTRWLAPGWFTLRAIVYFAIWSGLALFFYRGSVAQDASGDKAVTNRLQYWSGPAVMAFSLTTTFAAFDWVMSLAPMWFSTMFGVYLFAGSILAAHCVITVGAYMLQKQGALRDEVTVEHYHDLGKYMFGFVFFWTYISFSQYLLIWYGNIPEETHWFYHRQLGSWKTLSLVLVFFHWMLPFAGLMSRHVRRNPTLLFAWAVYLLVVHFIDIYWMIMPESRPTEGAEVGTIGGHVGVLSSILCGAGMLALLTGLVLRLASQTKVVAVRDPRLRESIAFENVCSPSSVRRRTRNTSNQDTLPRSPFLDTCCPNNLIWLLTTISTQNAFSSWESRRLW